MTRYIDADKLIKWCNDTYDAQTTFSGKAYISNFLEAIAMCEKVDVVPRAEVDKAKQEVDMEIITEFKELVKQYLLDRFILPVFVKNALAHAETELKKKYIGEC